MENWDCGSLAHVCRMLGYGSTASLLREAFRWGETHSSGRRFSNPSKVNALLTMVPISSPFDQTLVVRATVDGNRWRTNAGTAV